MRRVTACYGLWLVLAGWSPVNAMVGIPAAGLAAWASVTLLPPMGRQLAPLRVLQFAARFLWQSVAAGVDVARRVFRKDMALHPGVVRVAPKLADEADRLFFRGVASLQPGSLACGVDEEGYLLFHCLDTRDDGVTVLNRTQDDVAALWKEDAR